MYIDYLNNQEEIIIYSVCADSYKLFHLAKTNTIDKIININNIDIINDNNLNIKESRYLKKIDDRITESLYIDKILSQSNKYIQLFAFYKLRYFSCKSIVLLEKKIIQNCNNILQTLTSLATRSRACKTVSKNLCAIQWKIL